MSIISSDINLLVLKQIFFKLIWLNIKKEQDKLNKYKI